MAIIQDKTFKPNIFFKNKHVNTLYRHFVFKTRIHYIRERIETKDKDFLDLDKSLQNSDKLILALHGLEGSANSNCIQSPVHSANQKKWQIIGENQVANNFFRL